jgi:hypothetical protein
VFHLCFFARSVYQHASNSPYVGLMLFSSKIYLLGENIMICLKKTYFLFLCFVILVISAWNIAILCGLLIYDVPWIHLHTALWHRDGTSIILSDDVGQLYILNTGQGESQKDAKYDQVHTTLSINCCVSLSFPTILVLMLYANLTVLSWWLSACHSRHTW